MGIHVPDRQRDMTGTPPHGQANTQVDDYF